MARTPFTLHQQEVLPGKVRHVEIPVSRLPSGSTVAIPVRVLHGSREGPTIWLSGAIHGDEIVGVEIIHRVLRHLDPGEMAGTVLAAPVVNVFGFVNESRYLPDRRDLNRSFPGSATGSLAARLAHLFMKEVVMLCDAGIDYHAGSNDRTNLPQVRGNMDDEETRRLAMAFGAPLVVNSGPRKGTLRQAALRKDKTVLLFEGGEPRRFSPEAVEVGTSGTLRVLAALGMVDAPQAPLTRPPMESRRTVWIRAPRGGIFRLHAGLGTVVRKREALGIITDPTTPEEQAVRSSAAGVVMGHTVNPLVHQGDALVHIAVLEEG